jgi:hypothetical protein
VITTVRTLRCDYCARSKRGRPGQSEDSLRADAAKLGWRVVRPVDYPDASWTDDVCRPCARKHLPKDSA